MHFLLFTSLFAILAQSRKTCHVIPLTGGQDSGPRILEALSTTGTGCGLGGKVVLDGYYLVDTVLETTGLRDVEIELSGTLQYTPDIAKWSNTSIYLTYQVSLLLYAH